MSWRLTFVPFGNANILQGCARPGDSSWAPELNLLVAAKVYALDKLRLWRAEARKTGSISGV